MLEDADECLAQGQLSSSVAMLRYFIGDIQCSRNSSDAPFQQSDIVSKFWPPVVALIFVLDQLLTSICFAPYSR
jgi:hypothetical protein